MAPYPYRESSPVARVVAALLALVANVVVLGGVTSLFLYEPAADAVARAPPAPSVGQAEASAPLAARTRLLQGVASL